jgi:hypothetical protein
MKKECASSNVAPNNGMHPTRDTATLIHLNLVGARVVPGVGHLLAARRTRPGRIIRGNITAAWR